MNNMCWCKDCKWFYKDHCSNRLSDACTEMMGDYNSCEHSEKKIDATDIRLEELNFSVRTYRCLARVGVRTIKDITKMTLKDLESVRNIGKKSIQEVITKLAEYGLNIKENDNE